MHSGGAPSAQSWIESHQGKPCNKFQRREFSILVGDPQELACGSLAKRFTIVATDQPSSRVMSQHQNRTALIGGKGWHRPSQASPALAVVHSDPVELPKASVLPSP